MSTDFMLIVLALVGFLYAIAVCLHLKKNVLVTIAAVLVAAFVFLHTFMLLTLTGDGRILPGKQLSPNLKAIWGESLADTPFPHIGFTFLILLTHFLILVQRPGRRGFWLPLPATLIFIGIFAGVRGRADRDPIRHAREIGPQRTAFLSVVPLDDKKSARIIVSEGERDAWFPNVLLAKESGSAPPDPYRLFWTKDGKGLVLMTRRRKILGIDIDTGQIAGGVPEEGHEWPRRNPAAESVKTQMQLARWAKAVDTFIREHGGIYVR